MISLSLSGQLVITLESETEGRYILLGSPKKTFGSCSSAIHMVGSRKEVHNIEEGDWKTHFAHETQMFYFLH